MTEYVNYIFKCPACGRKHNKVTLKMPKGVTISYLELTCPKCEAKSAWSAMFFEDSLELLNRLEVKKSRDITTLGPVNFVRYGKYKNMHHEEQSDIEELDKLVGNPDFHEPEKGIKPDYHSTIPENV